MMAYLVSRGCNFPHILHANTDFTGAKPAKSVFLNVRCFPPDRNLKITLKLSNNFTCRHGLAALRFQRNLNLFAVNLISGSQCLLANRRRSAALFGGGGVKTQCPVGCIWLDNKVCFAGWKFVINAQFFGLDTHFDDVFTVPRNLPFRFVAYVDSAWFVCFPSGFFDLFSSLVCTMINRYRPIGV